MPLDLRRERRKLRIPIAGAAGYTVGMADAAEEARWFRVTPGHLLPVLLAAEGLLWLSERFQWMSKGWPVVTAIGALGVFFLLMLLWFLLALRFRWRFQFSILSLLVLMIAVALPFSWLATEMKAAKRQREVVGEVWRAGGSASYDYEFDPSGQMRPDGKPPGPAWLRKPLGDDHFADVTYVILNGQGGTDAGLDRLKGLTKLQLLSLSNTKVSDAGLEQLKGLTQLQGLSLDRTKVSDAGLELLKGLTKLQGLCLDDTRISDAGLQHLKGLTQLQVLTLDRTRVTGAGVKKLQQALPNCYIQY